MSLPFRLILITDWQLDDILQRIACALKAGPGIAVQHRHLGASDRQFFDEAKSLMHICQAAEAPLFINRRLDIARAVGSHLHLPAYGLLPTQVRAHLGKRWISVAAHNAQEAQAAAHADLVVLSPIFPPGSKRHDLRRPLGPNGFKELARQLPRPTFALGGLNAHNISQLKGVSGVAVMSAVLAAANPEQACFQLLASL